MQITPSDVGSNNTTSNRLDINVTQLVQQLANKPLLIEKLVLSQSQGILLQLMNMKQNLSIQLPIKMANYFQNSSQSQPTLLLNLNKQQVQLTLSTPQNKSVKTPIEQPFLFKSAKLLTDKTVSESILKLDDVKPLSVNQQAAIKSMKQSISSTPYSKGQKNLNSSNTTIQQTVNNKVISGSHSKIKTNSSASVSNTALIRKALLDNKITVASAATQLLKNHFSKQLPLSNYLTKIIKINQSFSTLEQPPKMINKLQQQIKQLAQSIEKPTNYSSSEIKSRIKNSGHIFENKTFKNTNSRDKTALISSSTNAYSKETSVLRVTTTKPHSATTIPPSISKASATAIQALNVTTNNASQTTKSNNNLNINNQTLETNTRLNHSTVQTNSDSKLLLLNIRSTLESLIKTIIDLNVGHKTDNATTTQTALTKESLANVNSETAAKINMNQNSREAILINSSNQKIGDVNQSQQRQLTFNQQQFVFKQANELLVEVKNVLSQIENNQLLSVKNDSPNLHQFLLDLPIKSNHEIDSFEMLFEHENGNKTNKKVKRWKVIVRFDLEPLGPMFAQVELENEKISSHIFAKEQETAALINQHLHVLKKSLFSAGVKIKKLQGSQGKIPDTLLKDNDQLVDTHV